MTNSLLAARLPVGDVFHDGSFHTDRPVFTFSRQRAKRYSGPKHLQAKPKNAVFAGTIILRLDDGAIITHSIQETTRP